MSKISQATDFGKSDGTRQTAREFINQIAANKPDRELNFVVEDVFNAGKKIVADGTQNEHESIVRLIKKHAKNFDRRNCN